MGFQERLNAALNAARAAKGLPPLPVHRPAPASKASQGLVLLLNVLYTLAVGLVLRWLYNGWVAPLLGWPVLSYGQAAALWFFLLTFRRLVK